MLENFIQNPRAAFIALACVFTLSACAETGMPVSAPMQLGAAAFAPRGYLKFCGRRPDQCGLSSPLAEADRAQLEKTLNEQQWANVFNAQPTAIRLTETPQTPLPETSDLTSSIDLNADVASPPAQSTPALDYTIDDVAGTEIAPSAPPERSGDPAPITDPFAATLSLITTSDATSMSAALTPSPLNGLGVALEKQKPLSIAELSAADIAKDDVAPLASLRSEPTPLQPAALPAIIESSKTIHLTPDVWAALNGVNQSINSKIQPMSDEQAFGMSDYWTLPLSDGPRPVGNCKHYALEKRKALADAGFSPDSLSIAIVRTSWGEVHAVLIVSTDQGDYVLDNLSPWIKGWQDVNYTWIERQVPGQPLRWANVTTKPIRVATAY
jgi:predicted transglutaminase-like cysteine proteinase